MHSRSTSVRETPSRANPQVWKLAEWLWQQCVHLPWPEDSLSWNWVYIDVKNEFYDKAKQLMYMFAYNAFTGPDDHSD